MNGKHRLQSTACYIRNLNVVQLETYLQRELIRYPQFNYLNIITDLSIDMYLKLGHERALDFISVSTCLL